MKQKIQTLLCIVLAAGLAGTLGYGIKKSKVEKQNLLESKANYENAMNVTAKPESPEKSEGESSKETKATGKTEEKFILKDKNLLSLGDGVSKIGTYQEKVVKLLSMKGVTNKADNGLVLANMAANINEETLKNIDIVMILGGTNDFTQSKELGTIADGENVDSFYGNVQKAINIIKKAKPKVEIVFLTPLKHGYLEGQPSYPDKNNLGYSLDDYAKSITEVCTKNSLPVIDLFNKSGIESSNISKFTTDNINLNEAGNEKVAQVISDKLNEIYK